MFWKEAEISQYFTRELENCFICSLHPCSRAVLSPVCLAVWLPQPQHPSGKSKGQPSHSERTKKDRCVHEEPNVPYPKSTFLWKNRASGLTLAKERLTSKQREKHKQQTQQPSMSLQFKALPFELPFWTSAIVLNHSFKVDLGSWTRCTQLGSSKQDQQRHTVISPKPILPVEWLLFFRTKLFKVSFCFTQTKANPNKQVLK